MVITFDVQDADTPPGKFDGVPIPIAPVVVCVIGVNAVLIHKVGVDEAAPASLVAFIVTAVVVLLHPVAVAENVKVELPVVKPVTVPPAVTDATAGLLLTHVPPVVGDNVVVDPTQIELVPVMLTVGKELTTTSIEVVVAH